MLSLKNYYQQRRDLLKGNKSFQLKICKKSNNFQNQQTRNQRVYKKSFKNQGILYVHASLTNTIVSLTNLKGKTQYVRSAGLCGFQGKKKRSTKFAIISILESIIEIIKDQKLDGIFICLKGISRARRYVLRCLKEKGLNVLGVWDFTPNPHNGCRPRKLRRG